MSKLDGTGICKDLSVTEAVEAPLAVPVPVSDTEVADAAKEILEIQGAPVLLSNLGILLGKKFGSLKDSLGRRKLKTVLEKQFGANVLFSGDSSRLEVQLVTPTTLPQPKRYDPAFWAAFSKPIPSATERWFCSSRPFDFKDIAPDEAVPEGWLKIDPSSVPSSDMVRAEREAFIESSILKWCSSAGRSPMEFAMSSERRTAKTQQENSTFLAEKSNNPASNTPTAEALLKFIDTIPEAEQSNFSLPLDLIRRFLS